MSTDNRSNDFVFISFCIMCQAYQAQGIVKHEWPATLQPVLEVLLKHKVNIIQMPCPESSFGGYGVGLLRNPSGLKKYSTVEYSAHCCELAKPILEQIKLLTKQNFNISMILGVENSPSCAVNYIYSNRGMIKQRGMFADAIYNELRKQKIFVPFVGINRRYVISAAEKIDDILSEKRSTDGTNV